jgi:ketosteroid isomerase-like protein
VAGEVVGLLTQGFDALRRRDSEAFWDLVEPDCVWVPPAEWPENAPVQGREAIWDFIVELDAVWEEGSYVALDAVDCGAATVVHVVREVRGKTSGVGADFEYWNLIQLRDGRMSRSEWFLKREDAIARGDQFSG